MKLIILAAGKGTRFAPLTDTIPKGMVPVLGEPLLKHVLTPYLPNVSDIIFVVNAGLGMQIKDYFGGNYLGHRIFYKIQIEQKGTMDALMTCKDLITDDALFCVANGDDLFREKDIKQAIESNQIGMGISKKMMPKNYLGVKVEDGMIAGFTRHDTPEPVVEDLFCNGFHILDRKIFEFEGMKTKDGELGLPHTLFEHLDTYPLRALYFTEWETVNRPDDIPAAEEFLQ